MFYSALHLKYYYTWILFQYIGQYSSHILVKYKKYIYITVGIVNPFRYTSKTVVDVIV